MQYYTWEESRILQFFTKGREPFPKAFPERMPGTSVRGATLNIVCPQHSTNREVQSSNNVKSGTY